MQIPKHPSVVINLAEDSTDSEHEAEPESKKQNILSGIDQFLKDARKSVEVNISPLFLSLSLHFPFLFPFV